MAMGDRYLFNGGQLMPRITVENGKLVVRGGKVGTEQACCCGCTCACYEVGVKGRWDNNENAYADPNNEVWGTGTANDCGYAQAAYEKLDYPVTIGGYQVTLNAGSVTVSQQVNTGCAGLDCVWPDATLTYGEDGCPNGVNLGEPVCTCNVTSDSFNCQPMFGDWGGTDAEICEKAQQYLDDHPPEINIRSCCPPSGTVWYAFDLYSGCCFFPEDWDGVSPYDPATDPFPGRDCGDGEIGGQGATLIGGPFRDQSECIDFYAGLGAQANRPGCVEAGRTCEETPCGENPLP